MSCVRLIHTDRRRHFRNQQHKIDSHCQPLFWLSHITSICYCGERNSSIHRLIITYKKTGMSHTQLITSPKLKHKIDKYVRYVNIGNVVLGNVVLFAKTSIGSETETDTDSDTVYIHIISAEIGKCEWTLAVHFRLHVLCRCESGFTAHIRSATGGYVFPCVCVHRGVPLVSSAFPFLGEYPYSLVPGPLMESCCMPVRPVAGGGGYLRQDRSAPGRQCTL